MNDLFCLDGEEREAYPPYSLDGEAWEHIAFHLVSHAE